MQGETQVIGKGGDVRTLFFSWSREFIKDYLEHRDKEYAGLSTDDCEALFVAHCRDSRWRTRRLDADGFRHYLRKAKKKLYFSAHPHKGRKTAISNWVENGMELPDAANCAGHKKIDTTKKYYVRVNLKRLKEKHAQFSGKGILLQ
jgi:site-specific recombinase XerD